VNIYTTQTSKILEYIHVYIHTEPSLEITEGLHTYKGDWCIEPNYKTLRKIFSVFLFFFSVVTKADRSTAKTTAPKCKVVLANISVFSLTGLTSAPPAREQITISK
jgi:hypothetical protein